VAAEGYTWPLPPPPNGQIDLREVFPRTIGRLQANCYRPEQVGLEWFSKKQHDIVAALCVKYETPGQVRILFTWQPRHGTLFGKGVEVPCKGRTRMEWFLSGCPYTKFFKNRRFLVKLAEVLGKVRLYPGE
jgi:hypothetical protein